MSRFNPALSGEAVFDEYQALESTLETQYDGSLIKYPYSDMVFGQRPLFTCANKVYVDDDIVLAPAYVNGAAFFEYSRRHECVCLRLWCYLQERCPVYHVV
jgi:hypothetical protein